MLSVKGKEKESMSRGERNILEIDQTMEFYEKMADNKRLVRNHVKQDVEAMVNQKRRGEDNVFVLHIVTFGYLLVFAAAVVLFSVAKSTGQGLDICLYSFFGVALIGQCPLSLVWIVHNKHGLMHLLLMASVLCQICCLHALGFYYCLFWCSSPPGKLFASSSVRRKASKSSTRGFCNPCKRLANIFSCFWPKRDMERLSSEHEELEMDVTRIDTDEENFGPSDFVRFGLHGSSESSEYEIVDVPLGNIG